MKKDCFVLEYTDANTQRGLEEFQIRKFQILLQIRWPQKIPNVEVTMISWWT